MEILNLSEEEELTSETEQVDISKEGIYTAMIKIDKCVGKASVLPQKVLQRPMNLWTLGAVIE